MAPQIFILGGTGFIGGQLTQNIKSQHWDYQIVALVRNDEQASKLKTRWPDIQTVEGDLDSREILVEEAAKADVVIQAANSDHNASVLSLIQGLSKGQRNGTYIQISGAASICDISDGYGQESTRVYDDVADIKEITSLDETHIHAITDQLVISEGLKLGVKTALVVPGVVHGKGDGPVKTKTLSVPWLLEAIRKRATGKVFTVGEGKNNLSIVHVKDLANALVSLIEEALKSNGGVATWGSEGVYYVESGSCVWGDVISNLAQVMFEKKLVDSVEVERLSVEDANQLHPYASMIWGSNMQCRASRLRAMSWKPVGPTIFETIPEMLM